MALFERILVAKGEEWIRETYNAKLREANIVNRHPAIAAENCFVVPQLGYALPNRMPPVECKTVKDVKNPNQYPSHKVRLDTKTCLPKLYERYGEQTVSSWGGLSSVQLDLHRVAVLEFHNWAPEVVKIACQDNFVIHRCHLKGCFNIGHHYFGDQQINQSTDYCKVWIQVNGVNVNICHHNPKCLIPGARCNQ